MVAALESRLHSAPPIRPPGAGGRRSVRPRHLRLVEPLAEPRTDGRPAGVSGRAVGSGVSTLDPMVVAGLVLAVVALLGFLVVRLVQGGPPVGGTTGPEDDPRAPVTASAGPGDQIVVVGPGDTLWGVALELAPGSDPRPIVDRLAEVNGGPDLVVGQRLVVPGDLVVGGTVAASPDP